MATRNSLLGLALLSLAPGLSAQTFSFTNVTGQSGLDIALAMTSPGIAVGDFDGDGWEDVVITGAETKQPQFFHNRANFLAAYGVGNLFLNVTDSVLPVGANDGTLSLLADIDNDGDADLVTSRRFINPTTGQSSSRHTGIEFYINQNVGRTFQALGADENLARNETPHGGLTLADTDLDGDLDVVYAHNSGGNGVGGPAFFLESQGGTNFIDQTANFGANIDSPTRYFSSVLCDFNGDRFPDLHCAVDFYIDVHCRNLGGGVFQNVTVQSGASNLGADMGLALGDPDMDGDFDLYSTNINEGIFYDNDGTGTFTNTAHSRGISTFNHGLSTSVGWGTAFADFDLDMDEDLIIVGTLGKAELFENNGSGHFTRASSGAGLQLIGRSLVTFDYDQDGDLDVLIGYEGPADTPRLYENVSAQTARRHWLVIDPRGTTSNADGIGCHIQVTVGDTTMHRMITLGTSFKSGQPLNAHFGLGAATVADEVKILWPSGSITTLTNVSADQRLQVTE